MKDEAFQDYDWIFEPRDPRDSSLSSDEVD